MTKQNLPTQCPCCSGKSFEDCCGIYLSGQGRAPTAEALMRSRYSAFATQNIAYIESTLLPKKRGLFDRKSAEDWSRDSEWLGLEIVSTQKGGEDDDTGIVEFVARYKQNGEEKEYKETGRFVRKDNVWYYADWIQENQQATAPKAGRNDPCPCGSGQKFKKCCGK